LWVRSYFVSDTFLKRFPHRDYQVESARGRFAWFESDYGAADRSFYVQPQFGQWTHDTTDPDHTPGDGLRAVAGVEDTWFFHGGFIVGFVGGAWSRLVQASSLLAASVTLPARRGACSNS